MEIYNALMCVFVVLLAIGAFRYGANFIVLPLFQRLLIAGGSFVAIATWIVLNNIL